MTTRNIEGMDLLRRSAKTVVDNTRSRAHSLRQELEELETRETEAGIAHRAIVQSITDDRRESVEELGQMLYILRGDAPEQPAPPAPQPTEQPPAAPPAPAPEPTERRGPDGTRIVDLTRVDDEPHPAPAAPPPAPQPTDEQFNGVPQTPLQWVLALIGAVVMLVVGLDNRDFVHDLPAAAEAVVQAFFVAGLVAAGFGLGGLVGWYIEYLLRRRRRRHG